MLFVKHGEGGIDDRFGRGAGCLWGRWGIILAITLGLVGFAKGAGEALLAEGWSQDLLARLLEAPDDDSSPAANADALVLRAYQLRTLRLGDPGRSTHLVSILRRMLPPESRLTEDRATNTLHILSTVAAQQAALEFVSAMDVETDVVSTPAASGVLPEDVRKALESLAATRPDSVQLAKIIEDASRRAEERMAETWRKSNDDTQQSLKRMFVVGGVTLLVFALLGGCAGWWVYRSTRRTRAASNGQREDNALSVPPSQTMEVIVAASRDQQERTKELQKLMESFSIAYQADRQRNTMMMEAVVRKHGELSATLEQMTQLRREMGENAGKMFIEVNREAIDHIIEHASATLQQRAAEVGLVAETASRKIEATANRLEVQNARAEALAAELERTQKEVDSLFEKLKEAQVEANEQRRIAYEKTAELAKREAALAGLSLLMQEPMAEIMDTLNAASGSAAPPALAGPSHDASSPADENFAPDPTPAEERVDGSNTVPLSSEFFGEDGPSSPDTPVLSCPPSPPRFRILPVA